MHSVHLFVLYVFGAFLLLTGVRAMYFLLVDLADRFHLLKYGLPLIFMISGCKMLLLDIYKTPVVLALGAVSLNLASSIFATLIGSNIDVYAPDNIRPYRSIYNRIRVYKFLRPHVRFSLRKVSQMV